jgi:hypothetical protein
MTPVPSASSLIPGGPSIGCGQIGPFSVRSEPGTRPHADLEGDAKTWQSINHSSVSH